MVRENAVLPLHHRILRRAGKHMEVPVSVSAERWRYVVLINKRQGGHSDRGVAATAKRGTIDGFAVLNLLKIICRYIKLEYSCQTRVKEQ